MGTDIFLPKNNEQKKDGQAQNATAFILEKLVLGKWKRIDLLLIFLFSMF